MGLFYRILGVAALFHDACRSIYIYHIVRIDWIVVAALSLYSFAGASALGLPWPEFPLEVPMAYPLLQTSLALSLLTLLLISAARQDTIFRPLNTTARDDGMPQAPAAGHAEPVDLRISGRFNRGFGHLLSLRTLPVRWNVDDTGSILLEAYIEEVHVWAGLPLADSGALADQSGHWSLIIPREALSDGAEEGILYSGLSARPAFRIWLPGRRTTAILSVGNASQAITLKRMFHEILKESAAKEAGFFRGRLEANLDRPSPDHPPGASDRRAKPGEDISWNNLIDFSR
jgi:hypothetical protein